MTISASAVGAPSTFGWASIAVVRTMSHDGADGYTRVDVATAPDGGEATSAVDRTVRFEPRMATVTSGNHANHSDGGRQGARGARRLLSAASVIAAARLLAASVTAALVASILSCGSGNSPTNVAPTSTCRSGESPPTVAQGLLLTTILGAGALGSPQTSTVSYAQGTIVPYCYAPSAGNASAMAVLDGSVVPASGSISMNADHVLWAFGNPSSGTRFDGMMTVPSDFTKIPYPEFYQRAPSFSYTVPDPYCAISTAVVAYPASYLGAFPLPAIQGAPLPAALSRGAAVKDYWHYGLTDPSTNAGCSGDMHAAFVNTLQRLQKLGADHVDVFQDAYLVDVNAASLDFDLTRRIEISDAELAWIVGAAKAAGLEVHEYMQIDGADVNYVPLPTPPTRDWASAYLDAYTRFIVGRAAVAQSDGIQAFQLDWGAYWFDWTPLRDLFITKMTAAARQVRGVYSGKILYGAVDPWISNDPDLMNSIDWFIGNIFGINFSAADNENITVPQLKQKYLDLITALGNALGPTKRPVVWQIYAQSHRDFLLNGWVEDGFCGSSCAQNAVRTDFSVQAIAYEAMLEAVSAQTAFTTVGVTARASWFVDVMLPAQSFPNISQSWRNKPAESILYRWFARPGSSALVRARE